MNLMILCGLTLLGRLGAAFSTHLVIEGDSPQRRVYFHQSEYRLIGTLKDMAADCTDDKKQNMFVTEIDSRARDQKAVEEVEVCVLDWNAHTTESEHRFLAESPVAKMFYFLKEIAPHYNDCSSLKYELSSEEDIANEDFRVLHQEYDVEGNEECGKIGLKKPLPEGGFAAMTVRIMKTREEALKDIRKNVAYFQNKFDQLEAAEKKNWTDKALALKTKAEEEAAKKAEMGLEDWRLLKKDVDTKPAFQLYKEDQEAALTKLLDKETITVSEFHDIEMAKEVGMTNKSWRIFKNENEIVKGDNEMEKNLYYGRNDQVKDVILEFFRFQVRGIELGKEKVIEKREERVRELIETAKDLLREKQLKKKKACEAAKEKWQLENENKIVMEDHELPASCNFVEKSEADLEKEAPEETLANVSGWYGHTNLPVNDCQLNEAKIDGQDEIAFELSINSPRSLVRMLNVANHYNFQMLLDFSGAKLASVIHDNDLYRLRAMLGFDFLGDYTWESYIDIHGNRVSGIKEIEVKNPWFDKDSKNEKYHHSKVSDRAHLQGIGDFAGKCHNVIIHEGKEYSSWKLEKADYQKNDHNLRNFQGWATEDGKDIPADKRKNVSKEAYYAENAKVYSNPDFTGGDTKNPMAYVNQEEQEAIIGDLQQNPALNKDMRDEQQKVETENAYKKLVEENELKKKELEEQKIKEAKEFKEHWQENRNQEDDWGVNQDENMEQGGEQDENEMDDDKANKKR